MSDNEDIEDIMEVPDPVVSKKDKGSKRKRESEQKKSHRNKFFIVDTGKGDPTDSNPSTSLGNGTDSDQQNPKRVQDKGKKQVQPGTPASNGQVGRTPMLQNRIKNEGKDQLPEQPSSSSIGSQKQSRASQLRGWKDTTQALKNKDKPKFEKPERERFGGMLMVNDDEGQVQSNGNAASPHIKQELAPCRNDQHEEQRNVKATKRKMKMYQHLPPSTLTAVPLEELKVKTPLTTVPLKELDVKTPVLANNVSSHPQDEVVIISSDDDMPGDQDSDSCESKEGIVEEESDSSQEEELSQSDATSSQSESSADEESKEDDTSSEGEDSDSDSDKSDTDTSDSDEDQEPRGRRRGAANYRLDLENRKDRRDLEAVTDLRPHAKLSNEQTVRCKDFKALRVIGIGAYGKVFAVRKLNGHDAGQVYAMKVIPKIESIHTLETARLVKNEREVLEAIQGSPFMLSLQYAFQTNRHLFLVTNFVEGGELYTHVQNSPILSEPDVCLYVAELVVALEHLHAQNIVYRDLKLENVLIDAKGHIVLADFGLSTILTAAKQYRAYDYCGTLEYIAPEVMRLTREGYRTSVDWWALGVLIVMLRSKISPFARPNLSRQQEKVDVENCVLNEECPLPEWFSPNAKDLVQKLLVKDPDKRLCGSEVRKHPFFQGIDWSELSKKRYRMPYVPSIDDNDVTKNFDDEFTSQSTELPQCEAPPQSLQLYRGFNYTTPKILDLVREHEDEDVEYRNQHAVENIAPRPKHLRLDKQVPMYGGVYGNRWYKVKNEDFTARVIHLSVFRPAEVDALMSCNHSNIISFYNVYHNKTEIWIITENLKGINLKWYIQTHKLREQECREIFTQLVKGVRHLHRRHLIHGDLRPEIVMYCNDNGIEVKLVDLSLARYNSHFLQWQAKSRYTIDFAPPELVGNHGIGLYSPAVDIWGLGATLYNLVVRHPPFRYNRHDVSDSPRTKTRLKEDIKLGSFNVTSKKWLRASPAFRNLVRWCLQKHPQDRPQIKDILDSAWLHNDTDEEDKKEPFELGNISKIIKKEPTDA